MHVFLSAKALILIKRDCSDGVSVPDWASTKDICCMCWKSMGRFQSYGIKEETKCWLIIVTQSLEDSMLHHSDEEELDGTLECADSEGEDDNDMTEALPSAPETFLSTLSCLTSCVTSLLLLGAPWCPPIHRSYKIWEGKPCRSMRCKSWQRAYPVHCTSRVLQLRLGLAKSLKFNRNGIPPTKLWGRNTTSHLANLLDRKLSTPDKSNLRLAVLALLDSSPSHIILSWYRVPARIPIVS